VRQDWEERHAIDAQVLDTRRAGQQCGQGRHAGAGDRQLVKATKAEACYFTMIGGRRGGMIFFEESDQARLPQINEPLLAALDAAIDIVPMLSLDDLKRGLAK
jgi:hypothetical protein